MTEVLDTPLVMPTRYPEKVMLSRKYPGQRCEVVDGQSRWVVPRATSGTSGDASCDRPGLPPPRDATAPGCR